MLLSIHYKRSNYTSDIIKEQKATCTAHPFDLMHTGKEFLNSLKHQIEIY